MKQIEKIVEAKNCSAVNVGKLSELGEYVLALGPDVRIPGVSIQQTPYCENC